MSSQLSTHVVLVIICCLVFFGLCVAAIPGPRCFEIIKSPREVNGTQIVVARFQESLDFLDSHPFDKAASVIIYNKGPAFVSRHHTINLPNIGRCDHTYLYHIVHNYDSLAPLTLFLPGSCMDKHKQMKTYVTCSLAMSTCTSVFPGRVLRPNVRLAEEHFAVDRYTATNPVNQSANPESETQKAIIRPFGKWYQAHFPNVDVQVACFYGIFAVAREHIRQHPLSYYQNFLDQLSSGSNPEVGHYMERSWAALFYPYQSSCVYPMKM